MFTHLALLLVICPTAVFPVDIPQPLQDATSLDAGSLESSASLFTQNISIPSASNISSSNVLKITCDPHLYGRDLKVPSCRSVFQYLRHDETTFTFAERDSGLPQDVPLPLRTLGNDGSCFVQPVLKQGAISGKASATQIGQAAFTMLQNCVVERGTGGMAFDIGGDNNVNVAISGYASNMRCDRSSTPGPSWMSCVPVFSNMRAGKQQRVFGYIEYPGVQEELPIILQSGYGNCEVKIDIDGGPTIVSWYEIWEAVIAIASVCARFKHKGGKARGLGLGGNIHIELAEKVPNPRNSVGTQLLNFSSVETGNAGRDMGDFLLEGTFLGFNQSEPFELVASPPDDDEGLVVLPGDSSTDISLVEGS